MQSKAIKVLLIIIGWISIALGVIGIVLPLLPTTPFILLAAACFAKSSKKFHTWIINHAEIDLESTDWRDMLMKLS